jgi:uncharacterized protein (DUF1499 family)
MWALLVLVLLGAGFSYLRWRGPEPGGIDDAYALLFGKADLGPVEFETLTRRRSGNDALACPAGVCPRASADLVPPLYPVPAERLREIVRAAAAADRGTELIYSGSRDLQDRFLVRTPLMRFPDTVDALAIARGTRESTLALYSRSQIGLSDFGANRARLVRWLARIDDAVRAEAAGGE